MNRQVSIKQVQVANVDNTENTMMVDSGVKSWVKKLTSRKFLMAMVPAIAAICAMFGYSENQVVTIASAAVIVISSIGYMYTEGKCDQESIKASMDALMEIVNNLKKENEALRLAMDISELDEYAENVIEDNEYET